MVLSVNNVKFQTERRLNLRGFFLIHFQVGDGDARRVGAHSPLLSSFVSM
jgi:hypothetical protein